MEGGAWSGNSYSAYLNSGGSLDASGTAVGGNPALLQEAYVDYIQPERLKAFEIGYKGIIGDVMLADINYHKTSVSYTHLTLPTICSV